jgi:lactoylglutathione lyase
MNFQGVVVNVADLDRSIEFYREVLGFTLLSQGEQLATVSAAAGDPNQGIVLRTFGRGPLEGSRHIGLRAFVLDADSADQLERIANELDSRGLLVSRRDHDDWTAVVGHDPDEVAIVVAWHPDGRHDGWRVPDDFLYGVGE